MSTSPSSENGISSKDRNFGFFTLNKRNKFISNSFFNDGPSAAERRFSFQKAFSHDQPSGAESQDLQKKRSALIEDLKQKVKILAEESVTRSYIHEESSNVTAFCGAVDACLRFGLILRRPVINYRESRTFSLLKEIGRSLPEAKKVVKRVQELEEGVNGFGNTFSLSSLGYSDSPRRNLPAATGSLSKYLWIRVALFQKTLDKIVDYLVEHAA
ncbi:unnamed protein product [Rodentolepis nana]|uniref:RUN domain-containing protein n=1 Tax=Rodentolepis nana TaxID=102285 RepID=A0A0R3T195_RODNA|nr:unnamed protein product [Rodentolepis nana]